MTKRILILIIVLMLLTVNSSTDACTIIMLSKGDTVLAGNNEDWRDPYTCYWVIPPSNDEYGRICFGFTAAFESAQGGMNDQGLFIDANAVSSTGWQPIGGKPDFKGSVMEHVLAHCANVKEAIAFFKENNVRDLNNGRFPIADRSGASVVVEYAQGKVQFIRKKANFQISTNFLITNYKQGNYPCYRYNLAQKMLDDETVYNVDLIKSILSAVHFEGRTSTVYSNIYDLKSGNIYIYNFHDFTEVVKINLYEELKNGRRAHMIPRLFLKITFANRNFITTGTSALFLSYINRKGLERTLIKLNETRELCFEVFNQDFIESIANDFGYDLLNAGRQKEAVEIFKYNTNAYPQSANTYDSLGEAYMINGEKELAVKNYQKSLELNPNNTNAVEMLKKLER